MNKPLSRGDSPRFLANGVRWHNAGGGFAMGGPFCPKLLYVFSDGSSIATQRSAAYLQSSRRTIYRGMRIQKQSS